MYRAHTQDSTEKGVALFLQPRTHTRFQETGLEVIKWRIGIYTAVVRDNSARKRHPTCAGSVRRCAGQYRMETGFWEIIKRRGISKKSVFLDRIFTIRTATGFQ